MKWKGRLEFPELLLAGVMVVTAGFAMVLWRSDPRLQESSSPVAAGMAAPSRTGATAEAKTGCDEAHAHSEAELSILPIAKGPQEPDLDLAQLDGARRVEVFEERRNEFLRMRMAELAEHAGGACGCGAAK